MRSFRLLRSTVLLATQLLLVTMIGLTLYAGHAAPGTTNRVKNPTPTHATPVPPTRPTTTRSTTPRPTATPSPTPKPTPKATPRPTPIPSPTPAAVAPAAPGHAKLFDPATISLQTLPNGVRSLVKETRGTGLVSVQIWVRAGSRYETSANNGVAHLVETLALQASKNYPPSPDGLGGGAASAIEALGGMVGSQTTRDATFYSATVHALFLPAAIRALSDAILYPNLSDVAVEEAKLEVENDLERRESDPVLAATDLAYHAAFSRHPYRRPTGGTSVTVENLTAARVRSYHQARYGGRNISVIVVGDVQSAPTHKLIAQYFNAATAVNTPSIAIAPEQVPLSAKTVSRRIPGVPTTVALAFRSPGITAPEDVVAMDVLLAHWKEGRDAVLRRVLLGPVDADKPDDAETEQNDVEQPADDSATNAPQPLAIGYDVDYLTQRDPGLFIISLVVESGKRTAAVEATLAEIAQVQRDGLDAAALQRAKTVLAHQYVQQSETVSGQAGALGFYEMIDSYQFAVTYLDRITRVTATDIKRVANKYLARAAHVQAIIEPAPRPQDPLPGHDGGTITASAKFRARALAAKNVKAIRTER